MLEHIKRVRDAKRREKEAAEQIDAGRRDFLRGAGATILAAGAASAIPSMLRNDIAHAAGIEGETEIDRTINGIRRTVNSQDVRDVMACKGNRLVSRMLQAFQGPIDRNAIKGTKYDASAERNRHCLQLAYWRGQGDTRNIALVSAEAGQGKYLRPNVAGYGNAFYFGRRDKILTAHHVFDSMNGREDTLEPLDIAVVTVSEKVLASPKQIVEDDTSLSNADINGQYVTAEGIDPDATSENGCKSYPGVAMKLSREWVFRIFKDNPKELNERLARSFAMVIPRGEAAGATATDRPSSGMSGAPVFMLREGRKVLAGLLHSTYSATDPETKITYDLGFFYGIEEVREVYSQHMRSVASR